MEDRINSVSGTPPRPRVFGATPKIDRFPGIVRIAGAWTVVVWGSAWAMPRYSCFLLVNRSRVAYHRWEDRYHQHSSAQIYHVLPRRRNRVPCPFRQDADCPNARSRVYPSFAIL